MNQTSQEAAKLSQSESGKQRRAALVVKTLLGSSQVETALKCVGSFLWACQEDVTLQIHDDGTLTDKDVDTLRDSFPSAKVISKLEADNAVFPRLAGYPACAEYRRRHPLAMKLFDICVLQNDSEPFLFCDSDVFFFRRFSLPLSNNGPEAIFMRDTQHAYALYPWQVRPLGRQKVAGRVNTGFMRLHPAALKLDLVEGYLSQADLGMALPKKAQWIEQTCWSILSQACQSGQWEEGQLFLASHNTPPVTPETVGVHFVSTYRDQLPHYVNTYARHDGDAVELKIRSLAAADSAALFWGEAKSRAVRLGRRFARGRTTPHLTTEARVAESDCATDKSSMASDGGTLRERNENLQAARLTPIIDNFTKPLYPLKFVSLFSASDFPTCHLSFVSAHEALGLERIVAVEDGTVSAEQADELRRKTGEWLEIIPARVAYDLLREKLSLPDQIERLLKSRRVLQKLFQIDVVGGGDYFYFDSDVVFLKKVDLTALMEDLTSVDVLISANPRFCAYSYAFSDISRIQQSLYRTNSGVFVQREGISVGETAARILGSASSEYLQRNWVEQSTRAQIYSNYRCNVFSEETVGEFRQDKDLGGQPDLVHFMGSARSMMYSWSEEQIRECIRQSESTHLASASARRNSVSLYYADRVRRHLFNRHQIALPAGPASLQPA